MANQIPLSSAVDAAGGYLIEPEIGEVLIEQVNRQNAVLQLASAERITSNREKWPVFKGRPTAEFVGEGADKPITGAEFGTLEANIKKIATFVVYTDELLEDARQDPRLLVNNEVQAAVADLADKHMIGTHLGGADTTATFTTSFDAALANTTQSVELGASADAFALALSEAMELVEANGYQPNGVLLAFDAKRHLRDARDADGRPLYRGTFSGNVADLEGLTLSATSNLDGFPAGLMGGAGSPGKVVAIVGDFRNAKPVIRNDIRTKVFDQAVIGTHNLARQNKTAVRWEMRMGFQVFDLNRGFSKIINVA